MIAQVFGSGKPSSTLSVSERLSAIGSGFDQGSGAGELWRLVGAGAGLLLLGALIAWLAARARRARWIALHAGRLAAAGLHDEELALFRELSRRSPTIGLPLITRQAAIFDAAAAELVKRRRPAAARRDLLALLLALRRRIPFERRSPATPTLERGMRLLFCPRLGRGAARRLDARIVAVQPHGLQIALDDDPVARELAPRLKVGVEAALVVRRGARYEEARVRIRGVGEGPLPQLLIDRPAALSPSRVRIVWNGADERVKVEQLERFSEKLAIDAAPVVEARIVATSSEGLVLQFKAGRTRHGEAIRVLDGERAGYYRGYVALEAKGSGGEVFVLRRGGERAEDAARPIEPQPSEEQLEGAAS